MRYECVKIIFFLRNNYTVNA